MDEKMTLNAGSSAVIEVPFSAHPQPEVTWSYNDGKFTDTRRIKDESVNNLTTLRLSKVVRDDTGKYKVKLRNEFGECSFTVKVTVLGTSYININTTINRLTFCMMLSLPHLSCGC